MLRVIATNFGALPETVLLSAYKGSDLIVINGEVTVDTTNEHYKRAFALEIATEDLPIKNSLPTAAFVSVETSKGHYMTVSKASIKDGNKISVRPARAYDSYGSYKLRFFCAFIPVNKENSPNFSYCDKTSLEASVGSITDGECYLVQEPDWSLLVLKTGALTFDETEGVVKASIPGLPEDLTATIPIIRTDDQNTDLGNGYFPATIENGVITISKHAESDTVTGANETYTKVFILLNP